MKHLKALVVSLLLALSILPSTADARAGSFSRPAVRMSSVKTMPRGTFKAAPRVSTTRNVYHTTVVHDSPLHSPWFWMWAMDNHQPQTTVVTAPAAAGQEVPVTVVQQDTTGAWVFVFTFVGGLVLIAMLTALFL